MTEKLKYILGILIALTVLIVMAYFIFNKKEVTKTTSNTNTVKTTSVHIDENTFTVEQVANIKKALTDSLVNQYGEIIKQLKTDKAAVNDTTGQTKNRTPVYSYVSEIDSNIIAKDSTGNATDEIRITSTFISPEPLAQNSLHLLKVRHKSFSKNTATQTTRTDSVFIKESKGLLDLISITPNISAGYGLIHKQFDFYTGIGISIDLDIKKVF